MDLHAGPSLRRQAHLCACPQPRLERVQLSRECFLPKLEGKLKTIGIIGGGLVGLGTAYRLQQVLPGVAVTLLEKEPGVGRHQTGHNSGVLHCGLYRSEEHTSELQSPKD